MYFYNINCYNLFLQNKLSELNILALILKIVLLKQQKAN